MDYHKGHNLHKEISGGLLPTPKDSRDFRLGQIIIWPDLSELPKSFELPALTVKDQGGTDFCFPAGTMVLTEDFSYKPIEEIGIGDFVITHLGNTKRVAKKYKRFWQGKKIEIKIKGDYRKITSTPNHPYFVVKDRREKWKKKKGKIKDFQVKTLEAQSIRKGDYLVVPKIKLNKNTDIYSLDFYPNGKRTTYLEDDNNFYIKVMDVKTEQKEYLNSTVYNLEVEDDNSYLVNGVAVHNCTAYATCGMSELQEKVELNPYWSFAVSKMISGDPDRWGQNIRIAMKAHVKHGAVEHKELMKYVEDYINEKQARYIDNYPKELFEHAKKHKKQSYFKIADYPDDWTVSDAIKATIWLFRRQSRAAGSGVSWNWPITSKIITQPSSGGTGHMIYIRGFCTISDEDDELVKKGLMTMKEAIKRYKE